MVTLNERLHEAFDKRVGGTAMLPASDLMSAMTAVEQLEETIAQQAERIVELNKECNSHYETCQQQAEAIRVKDGALDWCIGEFNLRLYDIDLSQETIRVRSARHIQPSPDILQDRDKRVAEACANLVNRFISGDGILNDTWIHEIEDEILSGEWRKYL